jgi:hypothetical protein
MTEKVSNLNTKTNSYYDGGEMRIRSTQERGRVTATAAVAAEEGIGTGRGGGIIKSPESIDITVSLSSLLPSTKKDASIISWSSSEGSSFDTAKDLAAQLDDDGCRAAGSNIRLTIAEKRRIVQQQLKIHPAMDSLFTRSTKQQNEQQSIPTDILSKNTITSLVHGKIDRNIIDTTTKADDGMMIKTPPKSRLLRPYSKTTLDTTPTPPRQRMDGIKMLKQQKQQQHYYFHHHSKKIISSCLLENVEVYSTVDIASGKEGVSTIRFLSKEDTDQVFNSKNVIPVEIAIHKDNLNDETSTVSTSVAGSTESLLLLFGEYNKEGEWSQKAVHRTIPPEEHYHNNSKAKNGVQHSKDIHNYLPLPPKLVFPRVDLSDSRNMHLITQEISFSCQRTVSSLESSITWDSQLDGNNNTGGNGSEDAVRGPVKSQPPLSSPNEALPSANQEQHLDRTQRRIMPRLDTSMDDRIRQLKEKIRCMQQSSNLEPKDIRSSTVNGTTSAGSIGLESVSMESTVSGLPSEAVTTSEFATPTAVIRAMSIQKPMSSKTSAGTKPVLGKDMSRCTTTKSPKISKNNTNSFQFSSSNHKTTGPSLIHHPIPSVIPLNELDDVSLMECPSTSRCWSFGDIETAVDGLYQEQQRPHELIVDNKPWHTQISTTAKQYVRLAKLGMHNLIDLLLAQRQHFQTKSRSEKIVSVFIVLCLFLFFILLITLIA